MTAPEASGALRRSRGLALLVLLAMGVHTYWKWRWGTLPELLWGCNVASLVIALGLWFQWPLALGAGCVWHLAVGEPGYVFGVLQTGQTTWISVVVHTVPTVAALTALRRTGLPRPSPYLALLLFIVLVPLSHHLTPPRFNINLAHQRIWFLQRWFPGTWDYRLAFSALMLGLLVAVDALLARWLGRPAQAGSRPPSD